MNVIYLFLGGGGGRIVPKTYDFTRTSSSICTRGRVAIDIINDPITLNLPRNRFHLRNVSRVQTMPGHVVIYLLSSLKALQFHVLSGPDS